MDLYRYISFESFVDMLLGSNLTFVSPLHKWDDKYEGFLYRALKSDEGKEIVENISKQFNKSPDKAEERITYYCDKIRCQCWTTEKDSVVMWSIYSHNNRAIMINADKEYFNQINVSVKRINYSDNITLEDEIERCLSQTGIRSKLIFTTKRVAFRHENEYRAFALDTKDCNDDEDKKIEINNIKDFIKGVMVHPKAPKWYVSTVRLMCNKYGVNFEGQSKIYEFRM